MKTIRNATFETNPSSTHALVILSKQEYEDFCNDIEKANYSYEDFNNYDYMEYETYKDSLKTPNGETVIAFGYYGQDY